MEALHTENWLRWEESEYDFVAPAYVFTEVTMCKSSLKLIIFLKSTEESIRRPSKIKQINEQTAQTTSDKYTSVGLQ